VRRQKRGFKPGEVEYRCKRCETALSGTNVTRLKTHLLNGQQKVPSDYISRVKKKVVKEVKAALVVITPEARSSERSLASFYHIPGERRDIQVKVL